MAALRSNQDSLQALQPPVRSTGTLVNALAARHLQGGEAK
jgi:hypothetical protein